MKTLYILVRIPKSGSQSLRKIVCNSLAGGTYFRIPQLNLDDQADRSFSADFRRIRRLTKGILFSYGVFSEKSLWKKIDFEAHDGDIISGHFSYGRPRLPNSNPQYITLLRNPTERMISEYNYTREGYSRHKHLRKIYLGERKKTAGEKSFSEYLEYLYTHRERYSNPATGYITGSRAHTNAFTFMKQNYFHFGILERMDLFANQLARKLNTTPCEIWVNKTKKTPELCLSDRDHEILNALLDKDIALYNKTKSFIANSEPAGSQELTER